ncbi:hypothetical protein GZH76_001675, partial [Campylobacter coli]|nr:hypothetical protein [Campylobacter coli]
MIWKKQDLINVSNDKQAFQSSVSKWSFYNDASRACSEKLEIKDFAFHTSKEQNPWWMLDLKGVYLLEYIEIFNRIKCSLELIKNIRMALSVDGCSWIWIDIMQYMSKDLKSIHVPLGEKFYARFIRLEVFDYCYFHLSRVNVFIRKYKGLFLMAATGGWGDRMIAFLNAMYLSEQNGMKFGYAWKSLDNSNSLGSNIINPMIIEKEEEIFSSSFIEKFSYTHAEEIIYNQYFTQKKENILDFSLKPFKYFYGHYAGHDDLEKVIKNIPKDFRKNYKRLWETIDFTPKINQAINTAYMTFKECFDGFTVVAIHMRSGDIVYSNKRPYFFKNYKDKATPFEIILGLVEANIHNRIILFGEDSEVLSNIVNFIFDKYQIQLYLAKAFIPKNFDSTQKDLFEIIFMSNCEKIFSTSGFARLASLLGNGMEPLNWYNFFTTEEKYTIFKKYENAIQCHSLQKAFSLFCFFMISRERSENYDFLIPILNKAIKLDPENPIYKLFLVDCLLLKKDYITAEKHILEYNLENACDFVK